MRKIDLKPIGNFVGQICEAALYGLSIAAVYKASEYITKIPEKQTIAGYNDAVGAIMGSGMFSHDKKDAIAALKRDGNSAFYGAIVHIAKDSSMFSHDKVKMIQELSEK